MWSPRWNWGKFFAASAPRPWWRGSRPSNRGERFLSANCLSACVYAFMGGRKRVAPQGSALGIHRMFANQEQGGWLQSRTVRRYDNGTMAAYLEAYSAHMGVSRDLIRTAEHISSSQIHLVTSAEMARWNWRGGFFSGYLILRQAMGKESPRYPPCFSANRKNRQKLVTSPLDLAGRLA